MDVGSSPLSQRPPLLRSPLVRRSRLLRRSVAVTSAALLALATAVPANAGEDEDEPQISFEVLSSRADQVTGGDALVKIEVDEDLPLDEVVVRRNGADITGTLTADPARHSLTGLVNELVVGVNTLTAGLGERYVSRLVLRNHSLTGPVFSGRQQYPFLCRTEQMGLGQPIVDNQDGQGYRVLDSTGAVVGWSRDCSATTVVDRLYRAGNGQFKPMPADGTRPDDMTQTTTVDGVTVDYVVRRERGTVNRFVYAITKLENEAAWNRRVVFRFDGGVAIGHDQGTLPSGHLFHDGLSRGYAVLYSTGTRTATHYNVVLSAETALMVKEHFIERYGVPLYTVGVGGSGGAVQQYHFGQNFGDRIIDAAIPQVSYPDMVTQTIHVGDCELLEYYMDVTDAANPKWRDWENRTALIGMSASASVPNPYRGNAPGATGCVIGWRGLTPLAVNPRWFPADSLWARMDPPGVTDTVQWTHWADLVNIYGVGRDGFARSAWDNTGVQYGLTALTSGAITPEEFLDLNAKVGSWKAAKDMVQEGCPFTPATCSDPAQFDPWSSRNMRLSPDGGLTPAPRTVGDRQAMAAAYRSGLVFTGDVDIPIVDWRHYLEEQLDMHNTHQSFASRKRMLDHDGEAGNQVVWFVDARPAVAFNPVPQALAVIDEWMANLRADPEHDVIASKPSGAVDRCLDSSGIEIAAGAGVWDGILNSKPAGVCTAKFPLFGTSRTVAGGPIEGGVFACHLQSANSAIRHGLYGGWTPSQAQRRRLEQIFPTGVCDYSEGDEGRP